MGITQWIFHEVALLVHNFQVELEFGMLVFVTKGGGTTRRTWRKTLDARMRINNKLKSHVKPGPGMEPRPQRMEGKRFYLCASPAPNKRPK